MKPALKDRRLAMRVTLAQEEAIKTAAASLGQSVTDFSVQTVLARANELLADQRVFELDSRSWAEFTIRLDAPPSVISPLRELAGKPSPFDS
jgi:uncharacterized protein (DUF1778 family)